MRPNASRSLHVFVLIFLSALILSSTVHSKEVAYGHQGKKIKSATIDATGNVQLIYDDGKKQQVTTEGHTEQVRIAENQQTVGWLLNEQISVETSSGPQNREVSRLIIFKAGRIICAIDPKVKIEKWKFWLDQSQAVIKTNPPRGPAYFALYGIPGAQEIDRVSDITETQPHPEWTQFQNKGDSAGNKEPKLQLKLSTSSVVPTK